MSQVRPFNQQDLNILRKYLKRAVLNNDDDNNRLKDTCWVLVQYICRFPSISSFLSVGNSISLFVRAEALISLLIETGYADPVFPQKGKIMELLKMTHVDRFRSIQLQSLYFDDLLELVEKLYLNTEKRKQDGKSGVFWGSNMYRTNFLKSHFEKKRPQCNLIPLSTWGIHTKEEVSNNKSFVFHDKLSSRMDTTVRRNMVAKGFNFDQRKNLYGHMFVALMRSFVTTSPKVQRREVYSLFDVEKDKKLEPDLMKHDPKKYSKELVTILKSDPNPGDINLRVFLHFMGHAVLGVWDCTEEEEILVECFVLITSALMGIYPMMGSGGEEFVGHFCGLIEGSARPLPDFTRVFKAVDLFFNCTLMKKEYSGGFNSLKLESFSDTYSDYVVPCTYELFDRLYEYISGNDKPKYKIYYYPSGRFYFWAYQQSDDIVLKPIILPGGEIMTGVFVKNQFKAEKEAERFMYGGKILKTEDIEKIPDGHGDAYLIPVPSEAFFDENQKRWEYAFGQDADPILGRIRESHDRQLIIGDLPSSSSSSSSPSSSTQSIDLSAITNPNTIWMMGIGGLINEPPKGKKATYELKYVFDEKKLVYGEIVELKKEGTKLSQGEELTACYGDTYHRNYETSCTDVNE